MKKIKKRFFLISGGVIFSLLFTVIYFLYLGKNNNPKITSDNNKTLTYEERIEMIIPKIENNPDLIVRLNRDFLPTNLNMDLDNPLELKKFLLGLLNNQKLLEEKLKEIERNIENNPQPTPTPEPTPADPGPTEPEIPPQEPEPTPDAPEPDPTPQPTNKGEKILLEIEEFFNNSNPKNFQEVKNWIKAKNYSDPLDGINLSGAKIDLLKTLKDSGKIPGIDNVSIISSVLSSPSKYKNYVRLNSIGDGNCFLNSFSILLTGKERDNSLALPLRVKTCLEFMNNPERFFSSKVSGASIDDMKGLNVSLFGTGGGNSRGGFAKNYSWLEIDDVRHLALILKREIIVISPALALSPGDYIATPASFGLNFSPLYHEPFVLYNSGGHFEPLIDKN